MYDLFILGQISEDINIDYDGFTLHELGGAVVYSGFAAGNMGHKVAVLPKSKDSKQVDEVFSKAKNVDVYHAFSPTNTSIKNQYHTADKEKRTSVAISKIEPYKTSDIPNIDTKIYHIAGLMSGDLSEEIIEYVFNKGKIALDVQGVLRHMDKDSMEYKDWENKLKYFPMIDFLKADAMEAMVLTGTEDRYEAVKILADWGAKEVMITHNTEVIVYKDGKTYAKALKPRNLSGRSGRGDTCFSTYITERLNSSIDEALLIAAATVSLKMENPGPFMYDRLEVEKYIKEFYLS